MHPIVKKYIERNAEVSLDAAFHDLDHYRYEDRFPAEFTPFAPKKALYIFDRITQIHFRKELLFPQEMYGYMEKLYPLIIKIEKERTVLRGIADSGRDVHSWFTFYADQKRIYETVPSASFMEQAGPYEHVLRQYNFYKSIVDNYSKKLYESTNIIHGYHDDIRALGFSLDSKYT